MFNPLQLMQIFKNPEPFMRQILNSQQFKNNPMAQNVIEMRNKGDVKGLEEMARNLYKEKGMDIDEILSQLNIKNS